MDTLINLLNKSSEFLQSRGVVHARLNAELIFAHVLRCKRLDLYLQFERPVTPAEADALRPFVVRRGKREPIQYILGSTEFHGLTVSCDRRALIPRPETEELVEHLAELLNQKTPGKILDLGTGTGCLGLALAKVFPDAQVTLVDQSRDALELANENAANNGLEDRIMACQSDWYKNLGEKKFDLIVSNPPYLTEQEWETAEPEVRNYEPRAALLGEGQDGTDDLKLIIAEAQDHLNNGGTLALETGIAQHSTLEKAASDANFTDFRSRHDLSVRPRFVFMRKG